MKHHVAFVAAAAAALVAGCGSYSERVVEKPVAPRAAERTVVTSDPYVAPSTTTTVYQTR